MTKQLHGLKKLRFEAHVYKKFLLSLQNNNSIEACGFLLGFYEGQIGVVTSIELVRNANSSPFSFAIAGYEYYRILRVAHQSGRKIIAVFHSHLDRKNSLSQADKSSLAHSEYPWVIGSRITTSEQTDLLLTAYNPSHGSPISVLILSEERDSRQR